MRNWACDIVALAPTRWKLRAAVKALNQALGALRLAKHPGKTFIGRIEKGFDFLGYHFSPRGLTLARQTIENFLERAIRLYEQERGEEMAPARLGAYVRRWEDWSRASLLKLDPHHTIPASPWLGWLRGSRALRWGGLLWRSIRRIASPIDAVTELA